MTEGKVAGGKSEKGGWVGVERVYRLVWGMGRGVERSLWLMKWAAVRQRFGNSCEKGYGKYATKTYDTVR